MDKTLQTPWPDTSTAMDHLYSTEKAIDSTEHFETAPNFSGKDDVPMAASINKVLRTEFNKNPLLRMWAP